MPRRRPRHLVPAVGLLAALLSGLLSGCSSEPLPDAAALLSDSATAMREVASTRVALEVDGTLPGVPIKSADGVLTKDGSAQGSVSLDMGAQPFVFDFVILGRDLYLKGPTGGFRKLSVGSLPYDPSLIMNPDRGVPAVLDAGQQAETTKHEDADGVDSYRVETTFPADAVGPLVPGYDAGSSSTVWIATEGSRLVKATLPTTEGTLTFRFTDFDAPTHITPPI